MGGRFVLANSTTGGLSAHIKLDKAPPLAKATTKSKEPIQSASGTPTSNTTARASMESS